MPKSNSILQLIENENYEQAWNAINLLSPNDPLINHKLNEKNKDGDTPLHIAVRRQQNDLAYFLILRGANITILNGNLATPLHVAANGYEPFERLQELCDETIINKKDRRNAAPLHTATFRNNPPNMQILLDNGADVNLQGQDECTPMHFAIFQDRSAAVNLLLQYNPDLTITNRFGQTPLVYAAKYNAWKSMQVLLKNAPQLTQAEMKDAKEMLESPQCKIKREHKNKLLSLLDERLNRLANKVEINIVFLPPQMPTYPEAQQSYYPQSGYERMVPAPNLSYYQIGTMYGKNNKQVKVNHADLPESQYTNSNKQRFVYKQ